MYARDLMVWLHERLGDLGAFEETEKRFESLRGHDLLPRGRENAGIRLSNMQIASAVLAFGHPKPGYGGHASLILGGLLPVGGEQASFLKGRSLQDTVARLIAEETASSPLARVTLSVERGFRGDDYAAVIRTQAQGTFSFVSNLAVSALQSGSELSFEHDKLRALQAVERSLGPEFFRALAKQVTVSRLLNRPLRTDFREYATEEEKADFFRNMGAKNSSRFLNLRVDAQVAWPKEPTRIEFGGHNLVLFPKTKDHSHSVSVDLTNEKMSATSARTLINRLLSVLSWCEDQPASLHEGWEGNPVPVPVPRKDMGSTTMHQWLFDRSVPTNESLLQCLAYYRDGLNAESVGLGSHAVLSYFRVFETKYDKKRSVIGWVNSVFPSVERLIRGSAFKEFEIDRAREGSDVGTYIYENCRVATAHAARDRPSDPDGAEEASRLLCAADVIRCLARFFIVQEFNFSDSYLSDAP